MKRNQRVLVIKLRHLGDVLLSSPVFSNLKNVLPEAEIDAFIWKEAVPMLEGHPAISKIIVHDREDKTLTFFPRMRAELRLLWEIRKGAYDLVINLTEGDRGALAAFVSGAKTCVGVDPGKSGFWGKRKVFSHLVKRCSVPRHTVEQDLDALRKLGIYPKAEERGLTFAIHTQAQQFARSVMASYHLEEFVLIHAVSRWLFKCLSPRQIASVIEKLDVPVILTGGPSEKELRYLEEVEHFCTKNVVNLGGKTSLKELGALMQQAKGVITVDSVSLHIASALKVPTLAIFGPTSEENWGPWQNPQARVLVQNRSCRPCFQDGCGGSKMSDCLWSLSPDAIAEAFDQLVSAEGNGTSSSASLLVLNSLDTCFTE